MNGAVGLIVGISGLLTAVVAILRSRSQNRVDDSKSGSIDRVALMRAVETVQLVYEKTLGTIQGQVKELLDERTQLRAERNEINTKMDEALLREKECRAELETLRVVQKGHSLEIKDLKQKFGDTS